MAIERIDSRIEGAAELSQLLKLLGGAVSGRVLRAAVKEAMMGTYARAVNTVPIGEKSHATYTGRWVAPGFTQANLRLKTWVSKDKSAAAAMVGVNPEAYYALQFVELGTARIPAAPWLTPAFEASKDQAVQSVGSEMRKRITRIATARAKPGYKPGSIRP
jgi:HK97 gp10 family phage protein